MSDIVSPWFTGSVAEAVNMATTKNVVFMVYIHDENEESQQMNNITESSNSSKIIKDKTVALRISRDSEEAVMFGQLFTITKVPSIYLIRSGALRDYVSGVVSEENLISRINTAASSNPPPLPPPSIVPSISSSSPTSSQQSSSSRTPSTTTTTTTTTTTLTTTPSSNSSAVAHTSENSNDDLISRTERIKSKIEEKRKKKEQEEIRMDKEREINRRIQGKAMQDAYRQQNEAKNKKIANDIAKQRKDAEEERRRIREQIALDKAERQARRQVELSLRQQLQQEEQEEIFSKGEITTGSYDHSNISVRLLNGDIVRKKFQSTQTLEEVRAWIEENRTDGKAPYNLIQNFPHRQYSINDESKSLRELNLCPSGTLICKPSRNASIAYSRDGGFIWNFFTLGFSMIGTLLSYINPFAYFYDNNRQRRQSRNSNNERHEQNNNYNQLNDNNNSNRLSERAKFGNNVRTLSQNDDDIDKRWTYNGNSTNQE